MSNLIEHPVYKSYFADLDTGEVYSSKVYQANINGKMRKMKLQLNKCGYLRFDIRFKGKKIEKKVHSFIFECGTQKKYDYSTKIPEGLTINHKDLNKLNNNFNNLELITHRKNIQLRKDFKQENKKSGLPKYVVFIKRNTKRPYQVRIFINGKQHQFSCYSTPEEASEVAKREFERLYPNETY